jgi:hypothetical protein
MSLVILCDVPVEHSCSHCDDDAVSASLSTASGTIITGCDDSFVGMLKKIY